MGQLLIGSRVLHRLTELSTTYKDGSMAAPQLPAGVDIKNCATYGLCDAVFALVDVPGALDNLRARHNLLLASQTVASLPGAAAHAAAEDAVKQSNRAGFPGHAAAEEAVLIAQGRAPAGLTPAEFQHRQAELRVIQLQG